MSDTVRDPARPRGIDPRGPRFTAAVTTVLLGIAVVLSLTSPLVTSAARVSEASIAERITDPAFLLLLAIAVLFVWGVVSPRTAPWGALFRAAIQPRLAPPREWEDPRPPRFAQGVGLFVVGIGLVLHVAGVPFALLIAAAMAFVAAFLNAVFGLCLGCQLYLLLQRVGIVGRARPA